MDPLRIAFSENPAIDFCSIMLNSPSFSFQIVDQDSIMVLKHISSPHPNKDDAGFRAAVQQAKLSLSEGGYVHINHSR